VRFRIRYPVDMRIVITGDTEWDCRELASRALRRIVARYGPDIVVVHGNELGVDSSFAAAASELGVTAGTPISCAALSC
jgi:YspA, cpYpsA-related SLOG family